MKIKRDVISFEDLPKELQDNYKEKQINDYKKLFEKLGYDTPSETGIKQYLDYRLKNAIFVKETNNGKTKFRQGFLKDL